MKQAIAITLLFLIAPTIAWAENITTTGDLIVDPPTLMAIGIAWPIQGDDNRNAQVSITYRKNGNPEWSRGLDPLRLQNEITYTRGALDYTAPNMFAGSLFDLEEDTEYEVRVQLQDPDGIQGESEKTVVIRTRAEPKPATDGRVLHVYPPGYEGDRQAPAFSGLLEAYYMAALGGDWSRASPPRVRPGDIIKVHAGIYLSKHDHYSHELNSRYTTCCGTPWDGTYYLTQDGTAERPIAIVAAGDGEAIFDGDGNAVLFNLMGAQYHHFEGITFRNTGTAIEAGMKDIAGAKGLTVKYSRFENIGTAIHSDWSGSSGFYIADNDMLGREDLNYVFTWYAIKPWSDRPDFAERAKLKSFYAISIYGQGHVIAYNRVRGFHDGIDHATYGMPDNYPDTPPDRLPVAIDIYNNDVSVVHDNCFEADGSVRNVRVMRNRCFNAPLGAMSPQPVLGGPAYFIRNVVYNAWWGPVKIHGEPSGVYYLNNTYIGEFRQLTPMSNVHLRNNLLLGQGTSPRVLSLDTFTNYSSSDYNGFRPNPGSKEAFAWNSPPFEEVRNFYPAHRDPQQAIPIKLTQRIFPTLEAYSQGTGQDRHSGLVDFDIFVKAPRPDFSDPTHVVAVDSVDLRLRADAAAIDAGIELQNVTDGFKGSAPDLGAYEFGDPLPHYGPRPKPD
ncbi:MAG: hypothetical protein EPO31_06040 [Gammaproteobacteria bacterium]|nr:MAG: hypothetical protein EPO31_06040 [Gammaproteobacteria bacterium]